MLGVVLALAAAFCFGAATIAVRLATQHVRPSTVATISVMGGGGLAFLVVVLFFREQLQQVSAASYGWIALIALFQFPVGRFLNYTSVHLAGIARAAPLLSTNPLFASLFGVLFLREEISLLLLSGLVAVTAGVILIAREGAASR